MKYLIFILITLNTSLSAQIFDIECIVYTINDEHKSSWYNGGLYVKDDLRLNNTKLDIIRNIHTDLYLIYDKDNKLLDKFEVNSYYLFERNILLEDTFNYDLFSSFYYLEDELHEFYIAFINNY